MSNRTAVNDAEEKSKQTNAVAANLKPIDSGVKTLQIVPTSDTSAAKITMQQTSLKVTEEIPKYLTSRQLI